MKRIFGAILFLLVFYSISYSQDKMRIAVMDLQAKGVSKVLASGITDMIRSDMVDTGLFLVVERNQMNEILKEQELQQTGCTDNACAVEIGKLLSARKILIGEITALRSATLITVRIVDVEKGVAEFSSKETAKDDADIQNAASRLSMKLVGRITGKRQSELLAGLEVKTPTGYYLRSIIPGWGQFYMGRSLKGYMFLGGFLAAGGFMGYAVFNFYSKRDDYRGMTSGTDAQFQESYDTAMTAGKVAMVSVILLAAVYAGHWVDILFFSNPDWDKMGFYGDIEEGAYLSFDAVGRSVPVREQYYNFTVTIRF